MSLDFAHSLKSGTLRVFVDDASVIEADLDSRVTRRIAGVTLRKGTLRDSFDVEPGRHEIRVRVAGTGTSRASPSGPASNRARSDCWRHDCGGSGACRTSR